MSGLNPNAQKGKKKDPKVAATGNEENASSSKKPDAKSGTPRAPNPAKDGAKANSNLKKAKPQGRKPQQLSTSTAAGSSSGQAPPTERPLDSLPKVLKHEPGPIEQGSQTEHERMGRPPTRQYSFGKLLGTGSYTFVFKCSDQEERCYAVKTLKREYEHDKRAQELVAREKEILTFLRDRCKRHESIVEFHESYGKLPTYFVFEELCGGSLVSTLESGPIKNVDMIKRVSVQALGGLQFLHEHNIVHCDIKPENIIFKTSDPKDYTIKIIDFGFSQRGPVYSNKILAGTPIYRPPEVFGHERLVSPKLDIWGFGVVLWEMFHGLNNFPIRPMSARIAMKEKNGDPEAAKKYLEEWNKKEFEKDLEFDTDKWNSNPKAVPLAEGILDKDHKKRLTAKQALETAWLKER